MAASPSETEIGGSDRSFPVTSWAVLEEARARKDVGGERYRRLVELYWKPVYCYIRQSWSHSNEDAKDLTQEFFTRMVLDGALVENYDRGRGGFRPFLKASVTNFLLQARRDGAARKRGGGVAHLSLSGADRDFADLVPDATSLTPEQAFDRAWERAVLARAVGRLEERLRRDGRAEFWEVFRRYEMAPRGEAPSYEELGGQLGLSADTVKNRLTTSRKMFLQCAKEVLAEHVDNPDDFLRDLDSLLGK